MQAKRSCGSKMTSGQGSDDPVLVHNFWAISLAYSTLSIVNGVDGLNAGKQKITRNKTSRAMVWVYRNA